MKNNHVAIIMVEGKQIGDYSILVAEGLVNRETIVMAIQKNHQRIIIELS